MFDDIQRAQIDHVRARLLEPRADDAFWSILLGDGASLYLWQEELDRYDDDGKANEAVNVISWTLPDEPGPVTLIEVNVTEEEAAFLVELRAMRPAWSEEKFWQQVIEWGVTMLRDNIDHEDNPEKYDKPWDPDDEIPF